ncbi:MAG TPA: hypothetical protein VKJ45_12530 [Blastocatellia bacterium]|nr:hypothetical protein [Blastocatellia bacterium]
MSRNKKVPLPYTATQADPGGKPDGGQAFRDWVRNDISFKESQPAQDYSTGSGSGINNGN